MTPALPLISIITPSKNRSQLLPGAVLSVLRQPYRRVEHIVMDACSTDQTDAVLARFGHLTVVREPDEGSHQAMNAGLKIASGDVIGFLNTDDVYADGIFEVVAQRFAADSRLDVVCGAAVKIDLTLAGLPAVAWYAHHPGDQLYLDLTLGSPCFNAWFFRASALRRLGPIDVSFDIAGDREFLLRAAGEMHIEVLPQLAYGYGVHGEARSLDRRMAKRVQIAQEHVRMSERYMAQPRLPRAANRYLRLWYAYEVARLAMWELGATRVPVAWIRRGIARDPGWPASVACAVMLKCLLRRQYRHRPTRFAGVSISGAPPRIAEVTRG